MKINKQIISVVYKLFLMLYLFFNLMLVSCTNNIDKTNCTGRIKGYIVYPGEGIPSDLIICAIDTVNKKEYRDSSKVFSKLDGMFHFNFTIPEGIYYVCAETDFVDTSNRIVKKQGFYTEYTKKKLYLKSGNSSHTPIAVQVHCDSTVDNIAIGDFWLQ